MDIAQQSSTSLPAPGTETVTNGGLTEAAPDARALSDVVGGLPPIQHEKDEQKPPMSPLTPSHFTVSFLRVREDPPSALPWPQRCRRLPGGAHYSGTMPVMHT